MINQGLCNKIILPGCSSYNSARQIFNRAIHRKRLYKSKNKGMGILENQNYTTKTIAVIQYANLLI